MKIDDKEKRRLRRAARRRAVERRKTHTQVHIEKQKYDRNKETDDYLDEVEEYYASTPESPED